MSDLTKLSFFEGKLSMVSGKIELLKSMQEEKSNWLRNEKANLIAIEEAQAFLQEVAKKTQEQLKYQISDLVDLAMETCFPNEYSFEINFEIKRGKTEAQLIFRNKNGTEIDPMEASGGGVVDLASFALRIAIWSLGKSNNVIILDEPFKGLQPKELHAKGMEIVHRLSNRLGLQFIIVTNSVQDSDIIENADRLFTVKKVDGISKVVCPNIE
jgi:DNA repair exonuclease SbcCD ATPase subunit